MRIVNKDVQVWEDSLEGFSEPTDDYVMEKFVLKRTKVTLDGVAQQPTYKLSLFFTLNGTQRVAVLKWPLGGQHHGFDGFEEIHPRLRKVLSAKTGIDFEMLIALEPSVSK